MTEAQAKTKWCPMIRYEGDNVILPEVSNGNVTARKGLCVASDCMFWRGTGANGYCGQGGSENLL